MIRVSVMYPKTDDVTFDMEYYKTKHFEIVERTMKPARWEIDQAVDGPYIAVGHLFYDSMEALGAGMGDAAEAANDVANFTNVESVIQVSQILD